MPNEVAVQNRTLSSIETDINNVLQKSQWCISELLIEARDTHFIGDDKGFKKWGAEKFNYREGTIVQMVGVVERFSTHKTIGANQKSDNPIPFSKLQELSSKSVTTRVVDNVVKKLVSDKPPSFRDVRKIVNAAKPVKTPAAAPPPVRYRPPIEERAVRQGRFSASSEYLFDIHPESCAATVRILAKHWKGKYHPDKPDGDADIFDQVVKTEADLLAKRGES